MNPSNSDAVNDILEVSNIDVPKFPSYSYVWQNPIGWVLGQMGVCYKKYDGKIY